MSNAKNETDVLIVGGGPSGLTLALLLARRGVRVIVAEKEAGIYPLPRAAHIDHEAMRVLQEAGVADAIMRTSRRAERYDFLNAAGDVLLSFPAFDRLGSGGWPGGSMIHQPSVEAAMRAELEREAPGALHTQHALAGWREDADGVLARLATPDGDREIRARFLVGADGARSAVRMMADIAFEDLGFEEQWLVIDTIVEDQDRLPKVNLQICDPARPTTCVMMGVGRHRWEFMLLPGETAEAIATDASIAALLAPWNVEGAVTLERHVVYTFHARVAKEWRKGPVLLAGDAAHLMPPFAGQGLCSGVRDAANLAWKFAAILNDGAPDALLDSYQPEREPNLRGIIGMATMMGQTVCISDPVAASERDRQMIAARAAGQAPDGPIDYPPILCGLIAAGTPMAGKLFPQPCAGEDASQKLDDALGMGPWLIARTASACREAVRAVTLDDPAVAPFRAALAAWLDAQGADAVLVRPDRHVFGTGSSAMLAQEWRTALAGSALPA